MDAWTKNSFCQHTWILESYGRNVLLLHDTGPTWRKLWSNKKRSMILEVEENEEILGYFVVGESSAH
jgi:hypothetical protein